MRGNQKQVKQKSNYRIPRSVQDLIPIRRVWKDGTFEMDGGMYSKSYRFSDINYRVSSDVDKEAFFDRYCALLNALDSNAEFKITVNNHAISQRDVEEIIQVLIRSFYYKMMEFVQLQKRSIPMCIVSD